MIVGFLHDNPGAPVVLGSVFHSKNPPKKTAQHEMVLQCGKLIVRLNSVGFEVLIGDSRFVIASDSIILNGKKITGKSAKHKWELQ